MRIHDLGTRFDFTNRATSPFRNTVVVKVVVQDVNDHPPVFLQPRYEARIHENAAAFPEPLVVSARDDDLNGRWRCVRAGSRP